MEFTRYTMPDYDINWHHRVVARKLEEVLEGKIRRLIILEPPQNGKSEQVSRRFPAYALGRNPDRRIIACSYNSSLAQDMGRSVQKIIDSKEYGELFPETKLASGKDDEARTQGKFEVVGHRGYYIGTGVDGTVTGKTADIGLIDDPIKNRDEAESQTYRDRVWNFFISTFLTRQFGNTGAIVICLTHWHEDDLVGRLLELQRTDPGAEQWEVVSFPAVYEEPTDRDPRFGRPAQEDPRKVGEPLWPNKYPTDELARRRVMMGEYEWNSLYQQNPRPAGGSLIKREWFKFADATPANARRCRGWDTASTEGDGDYSVGVKIAELNGQFFVEDVVRGQWSPDTLAKTMLATAELDGLLCAQREEKEGGSAGITVISARTKLLNRFNYAGVPITGSKLARSRPFRGQLEAGNVFLIRAPWNKAYIDELTDFPNGKHDDQLDGTSCSYNSVLLEPANDNILQALRNAEKAIQDELTKLNDKRAEVEPEESFAQMLAVVNA